MKRPMAILAAAFVFGSLAMAAEAQSSNLEKAGQFIAAVEAQVCAQTAATERDVRRLMAAFDPRPVARPQPLPPGEPPPVVLVSIPPPAPVQTAPVQKPVPGRFLPALPVPPVKTEAGVAQAPSPRPTPAPPPDPRPIQTATIAPVQPAVPQTPQGGKFASLAKPTENKPAREIKTQYYLFDRRGPEEVRSLSKRYLRESADGKMVVSDLQDRSREYAEPKARFFVERYEAPTKEMLDSSEALRMPNSPGYTEKKIQ
jgi:hypothetical protein